MIDTYITGASGFIGKRLMDRQRGPVRAIPHGDLETFFPESCRCVFFLSAYGNLHHQTNAAEIVKANCVDPIRLASRMPLSSLEGFVFVSTSSVSLRVQTAYSQAKLATELHLRSLVEQDFPAMVVRPFSVTGVGEHSCHLIPTLIRSCLKGEPMKFDPNGWHDFIDVDDVVSGLMAASELNAYGPWELGRGKCYSNEYVRELVEYVTGKKANLKRTNGLRSYDELDWKSKGPSAWPSNWTPKKPLLQSLSEMVKAYECT